jgi:hypothetical protein
MCGMQQLLLLGAAPESMLVRDILSVDAASCCKRLLSNGAVFDVLIPLGPVV